MKNNRIIRKGFTLVELSLAMAFLAVLLITIAILVIRIITIYQRGLAIRAISATGRQLIDEFTRSIANSAIVKVDFGTDMNDTSGYFAQRLESVDIDGRSISGTQVGGVFCTGLYSYIWNTPYSLNANKGVTFKYKDLSGVEKTLGIADFRLLKVPDNDRELCLLQNNFRFEYPRDILAKNSTEKNEPPAELLPEDENPLALYNLRIFPASVSRLTGHIFYPATFILATVKGGIDITRGGDYCEVDSTTLNTDFSYCAINKFNFAMRATGESKEEHEYGQREEK